MFRDAIIGLLIGGGVWVAIMIDYHWPWSWRP